MDGVPNYMPWKVRITAVLKKWKICKFANNTVTKPTNKDELEEHEALEARGQRVILYEVEVRFIPHLAEKKTTNYSRPKTKDARWYSKTSYVVSKW